MVFKFRYTTYSLALMSACLTCLSSNAIARDFFNPAFLNGMNGSDQVPDLSAFEHENSQSPGKYRVDIIVNDVFIDTRDVEFIAKNSASGKNSNALQPCLGVKDFRGFGIRTDSFANLIDNTQGCADISVIPEASYEFTFSTQTGFVE